MSAPPAKKSKESNSLVIQVNKNELDEDRHTEKLSPVHRINGFPWRLRFHLKGSRWVLSLICEKSTESVLWRCTATIKSNLSAEQQQLNFASWDSERTVVRMGRHYNPKIAQRLEVEITTNDDGESWRRIPTLATFAPRDGVLVIGDEKEKLFVNKESLASQSPYFDRLFFGDFKEKNMTEIPIGDVEYEEFTNIIQLIYGWEWTSLTDDNVHRVLQLADRFELKIVEDRVIHCMLFDNSLAYVNGIPILTLSIHQKLLIADQFNLTFLMDRLISQYKEHLILNKSLCESPELEQLSSRTLCTLYKMRCERIVTKAPVV